MRDKFSRRLASYALVAALAVASALAAGRARKPFSPAAPEFRQRGPADAKIKIVEFSDFQCPACRYAEAPLRQVFTVYDGKIRFIFKHYPLRMHEWAKPAALDYFATPEARTRSDAEFSRRRHNPNPPASTVGSTPSIGRSCRPSSGPLRHARPGR